jgi:hypothetical protein
MADDEFDDGADAEAGDTLGDVATVTVEGPGVSITRPVDEATMSSVIALLFGAAPWPRVGGGGGGGVGGTGAAGGRGGGGQQSPQWDEEVTLGEFLVDSGASTFQQKICATGYYLMKIEGAESFNRDEVRTALANAHEDMPGNFSRDFSDAASKNLIAPKQGEPGRYIVPRTGRTAVESHFQDVPKRKARKTTKKSGSKGSAG